jgi:ubiquinone/menaquinone biosynthesis C-methylase UbiE
VDEEAKMAMDVLVPRCGGDIVVDMSCGSGLFTRKFLQSGLFSRVVAVDYSESMLEETYRLITEDVNLRESKTEYSLVQCDAARLAFPHASILGIHAGAAIHCWPDPLNAVAEMSRVLKPGGVFVGTTFLSYVSPLGEIVQNDDIFKALRPFEPTPANGFRWWNEDELRDLCLCCGFREFKVVERKFRYIMFAATK